MVSCRDNETNPLKDIRWKLTTFVDENGITREPEPADTETFIFYTIIFHSDNIFSGTSSRYIGGTYNVDFKKSTLRISISGNITTEAETFDGYLYFDKLQQIQTFSLTETELILYGNDKSDYLIFKPL
jgi:hypothetical protein